MGQRRVLRLPASRARDASSCGGRRAATSRSPSSVSTGSSSSAGPPGSASRWDPAAPAPERRAPSLRLLHDLGSEDDARLATRAILFALLVAARRGLRPVPPLPHERPPLVARRSSRSSFPCIDRLVAGPRGTGPRQPQVSSLSRKERAMNRSFDSRAAHWSCRLLRPARPAPFCGFYVAKADAKLFNRASQVVLVRDGDRTVLTMANDFQGDPKEFAVVVPVPTVPGGSRSTSARPPLIDHLDAYSAPRLVEYLDPDPAPCARRRAMATRPRPAPQARRSRAARADEPRRDGRGALHRRRVRHPDPLRARSRRAGDLARGRTATAIPPGASRGARRATSSRTCASSWRR